MNPRNRAEEVRNTPMPGPVDDYPGEEYIIRFDIEKTIMELVPKDSRIFTDKECQTIRNALRFEAHYSGKGYKTKAYELLK